MNKEIKTICKAQEIHLRSAVESGYKRATTTKEIDDMAYVYKQVFKREWTESKSCPICVLRLYRKVGEWFFSEIERVQVGLERITENVEKQKVKNKENKKVTNK